MRIIAPLILGAVPLLITPGVLFHFDITPKIALFLAAVAFLLILCISDIARNLARWRTSRLAKTYALLLALQWFWFAAATVASTHPALSLHGSGWRRLGLITLFAIAAFALTAAASAATAPGLLDRILWTVSLVGGCIALYGIAQYFGIDPFQNSATYLTGEPPYTIVRPPATLGHADFLAAALLPVVFLGVLAAQRASRLVPRIAGYVTATLAAIAIPLSGTRAALLGLAAGGLFSILISRRMLIRRTLWRGRTLACAILAVACASAFTFSPAGAKLRARLFWISQDTRGGARLLLWRDSIRMIASRPALGYGPETFSPEFPRFQSVELARAYPDFYHESPHNILLDAAVQSGLPGALLLLALIVLTFRTGISLIRTQPSLGIPLFAAWLALLIALQFASFVLATALPFFFLSALLVALSTKPYPRATIPLLHSRNTAWAVRFISAAPACALLLLAIRLVTADAYLLQAHRAIAAGNADTATRAYRLSRAWIPAGTSDDLSYSRDMSTLARSSPIFGTRLLALAQSLDSGTRAVTNSEDRQNAWYNLAEVFAERNDPVAVERSLRAAIAWAPNWFKPHWTLARVLALAHHPAEAAQEAGLALRLDGGKHPEVAQTLATLHAPHF